jgi:NDP-sugar pyrophosphorylase family protein
MEDQINETFCVSNCDIVIDADYSEILDYHREHKNEITLVAALKHFKIPYGTLETEGGGRLIGLQEKPEVTYLINAGLYLLEPHLLSEIPKDTFFHITDLIEAVRARGGRVGVFPVSEKSWHDIGEWQEYGRTMKAMGIESNL